MTQTTLTEDMDSLVDSLGEAAGMVITENMATMRKDLQTFLDERGWYVTGSGYGLSRFTNGTMADVSVKKGTKHLVIEIHEFEVSV